MAPTVGEAQSTAKVDRVGFLSAAAAEPFRDSLRELGYVEGHNLLLEVRLARGRLELLPAFAAELVAARVDVIAAASPPAIQAAKEATATIPIVMAVTSIDPIRRVRSQLRPARRQHHRRGDSRRRDRRQAAGAAKGDALRVAIERAGER
ncbi:MAG TPA: ABC transporter substrate binding protein [Casimicrobiaceae bacterium]|nr:ABC transporter substrate binding protein [Casimicrobiaceae bacterium]